MRKTAIWLVVWLGSAPLMAGTEAVQCQVKGQGPSREIAIQNALCQAVGRVHGVAVYTGLATVGLETGSLDVVRDPTTGSRNITVDAVAARGVGTITLTEAQGMVKTFEVVSEREVSPKVYEVTLDVWVWDYHGPEDTTKLRLAVMPVEVTAAVCRFGDTTVSAARVGEQFTQSLVGALAQNEKFTVLDRDSDAAIAHDRRTLTGNNSTPEERARQRDTLGADYLLTSTVPQAELFVKTRTNPIIGRPTREFDARVHVEFRVLVGPTRQVKMADELRIRLEDAQVQALAAKWESEEIDYAELQQSLIRLAAARVATAVADCLNPVKVAAIDDDGQVILSQGGNRFLAGDLYEVYKPGKPILDPDTNAVLATQEKLSGRIQIAKVLPRISYAKIVQGSIDESAVGAVCRRAKGMEDLPSETGGTRTTGTRKTPSGGVKLPSEQ
jgi:curli biogenesis system outer membrane secretion channel CsgG